MPPPLPLSDAAPASAPAPPHQPTNLNGSALSPRRNDLRDRDGKVSDIISADLHSKIEVKNDPRSENHVDQVLDLDLNKLHEKLASLRKHLARALAAADLSSAELSYIEATDPASSDPDSATVNHARLRPLRRLHMYIIRLERSHDAVRSRDVDLASPVNDVDNLDSNTHDGVHGSVNSIFTDSADIGQLADNAQSGKGKSKGRGRKRRRSKKIAAITDADKKASVVPCVWRPAKGEPIVLPAYIPPFNTLLCPEDVPNCEAGASKNAKRHYRQKKALAAVAYKVWVLAKQLDGK